MTSQERDELLIRLDMRTEALEKWTLEHAQQHKEHRTFLLKLFLPCITLAGTALIKAFL
jgi:hypothetical protein